MPRRYKPHLLRQRLLKAEKVYMISARRIIGALELTGSQLTNRDRLWSRLRRLGLMLAILEGRDGG